MILTSIMYALWPRRRSAAAYWGSLLRRAVTLFFLFFSTVSIPIFSLTFALRNGGRGGLRLSTTDPTVILFSSFSALCEGPPHIMCLLSLCVSPLDGLVVFASAQQQEEVNAGEEEDDQQQPSIYYNITVNNTDAGRRTRVLVDVGGYVSEYNLTCHMPARYWSDGQAFCDSHYNGTATSEFNAANAAARTTGGNTDYDDYALTRNNTVTSGGWFHASIPSAAAWYAIVSMMVVGNSATYGGTDGLVEGRWRWVGGRLADKVWYTAENRSNVVYSYNGLRFNFTRWGATEPNTDPTAAARENYAELKAYSDGRADPWQAIDLDEVKPSTKGCFLCERQLCDARNDCRHYLAGTMASSSPTASDLQRLQGAVGAKGYFPRCSCYCRRGFAGGRCRTLTTTATPSLVGALTATRPTQTLARPTMTVAAAVTNSTPLTSSRTLSSSTSFLGGSASSTPQLSRSLGPTASRTIALLKPIAAPVEGALTTAASGVVVAGAILSPAGGGAVSIGLALLRASRCATEDKNADTDADADDGNGSDDADTSPSFSAAVSSSSSGFDELPTIVNPTGLRIGASYYASPRRGAIIANALLIPLALLTVVCLPVGYWVYRCTHQRRFVDGLYLIGCPSIVVLPFSVLAEGIGMCVMELLIPNNEDTNNSDKKNGSGHSGGGDSSSSLDAAYERGVDVLCAVIGIIVVGGLLVLWGNVIFGLLPRGRVVARPQPAPEEEEGEREECGDGTHLIASSPSPSSPCPPAPCSQWRARASSLLLLSSSSLWRWLSWCMRPRRVWGYSAPEDGGGEGGGGGSSFSEPLLLDSSSSPHCVHLGDFSTLSAHHTLLHLPHNNPNRINSSSPAATAYSRSNTPQLLARSIAGSSRSTTVARPPTTVVAGVGGDAAVGGGDDGVRAGGSFGSLLLDGSEDGRGGGGGGGGDSFAFHLTRRRLSDGSFGVGASFARVSAVVSPSSFAVLRNTSLPQHQRQPQKLEVGGVGGEGVSTLLRGERRRVEHLLIVYTTMIGEKYFLWADWACLALSFIVGLVEGTAGMDATSSTASAAAACRGRAGVIVVLAVAQALLGLAAFIPFELVFNAIQFVLVILLSIATLALVAGDNTNGNGSSSALLDLLEVLEMIINVMGVVGIAIGVVRTYAEVSLVWRRQRRLRPRRPPQTPMESIYRNGGAQSDVPAIVRNNNGDLFGQVDDSRAASSNPLPRCRPHGDGGTRPPLGGGGGGQQRELLPYEVFLATQPDFGLGGGSLSALISHGHYVDGGGGGVEGEGEEMNEWGSAGRANGPCSPMDSNSDDPHTRWHDAGGRQVDGSGETAANVRGAYGGGGDDDLIIPLRLAGRHHSPSPAASAPQHYLPQLSHAEQLEVARITHELRDYEARQLQ